MELEAFVPLLQRAVKARHDYLDSQQHTAAVRLFNGFYEGYPELVVDLFGSTVVLHNYAASPETLEPLWPGVRACLGESLPWIRAMIVKDHAQAKSNLRRGRLIFGADPDRRINEHGVSYAIDLLLHGETTFYLDTANLRAWARCNLMGKTVLNTFAYTGSLGIAAAAGGAAQVIHLDRNRSYLNVAKVSYALNGFAVEKKDFVIDNFFPAIKRFIRQRILFDCVLLDPPLFSTSREGTVDLLHHMDCLINKVRPLVADNGHLVCVNNALFLSGSAFLADLNELSAEGYLELTEIIPVPLHCTGYPETRVGSPPTDPSPFNHPTKIAVLRVRRKDGRGVGSATSLGRQQV